MAGAVTGLVNFLKSNLQDRCGRCTISSYYNFILPMTTISVPLPAALLKQLEDLIHQGKVPNKAAAMRAALEKYLEDQAVEAVLRAEREPSLHGDLDELMKKV